LEVKDEVPSIRHLDRIGLLAHSVHDEIGVVESNELAGHSQNVGEDENVVAEVSEELGDEIVIIKGSFGEIEAESDDFNERPHDHAEEHSDGLRLRHKRKYYEGQHYS